MKHNQELSQIKPYKKNADYSYTLGAFPTYELIAARPEIVRKVLMHSGYTDQENLKELCSKNRISVEINDKLLNRITDKENCYVAGVFDKYSCKLCSDRPHIVLVNPGNMGNLGTIMRTAVGFGIYDIAIILPSADVFSPKTVRSSMGAIFRMNHCMYHSFSEYQQQFNYHELFTFMLKGEKKLTIQDCPKVSLFSLVFGNEAAGLDDSFLKIGTSVLIPQSSDVDSLNLTIAVGIGSYVFTNSNKL
jgi:TrmH family RNA methyltransferase